MRPRRGPRLTVLPDAARVEERLQQLARTHGFVAGPAAGSVGDLERELVREAQRGGVCPPLASPAAVRLALREAARGHSAGPFFRIREQPGYARALGELLAALTQGLLDPAGLLALDVPERMAALARTLLAARRILDAAGLVEPHRAGQLALESFAAGRLPPLPDPLTAGQFGGILDRAPRRLRPPRPLPTRPR